MSSGNRPATMVDIPPHSSVVKGPGNTSTIGTSTSSLLPPPLSLQERIPPLDPHSLLDSYSRRNNDASGSTVNRQSLDPVQFLNRHYQTEAALSHQLNDLRLAVNARMTALDDRISWALQRQSETAANTRQNLQAARQAISTLTDRIYLVQEKAAQSEKAVLSITADMKLLDTSKRHLQRTITTLKRLHMLVHAVEELRLLAAQAQPDFKAASHLVQAINILAKHFDVYTHKVPPLQKLSSTVQFLQTELQHQVVQGFRRTALGVEKVRRLERQERDIPEDSVIGQEEDTSGVRVMTPEVMRGGVLYLDALGISVRRDFIANFCQDLLRVYVQDFAPPPPETAKPAENKPRISSFKVIQEPTPEPEKPPLCYLDTVEKRFLWFRQVLEDEVQPKFGPIFPSTWNLQVSLARAFLMVTKQHFSALLQKPPNKQAAEQASNATVLLKALQKTLVFEKEITSWLIRECQTEFAVNTPTASDETALPDKKNASKGLGWSRDEEYASGGNVDGEVVSTAVEPLQGVASVAFENYMAPYIALEEKAMREQLAQALEDRTVDNRGELPVFISSTNLFVYIKGSIARCTALTRGKPFFLLYQEFGNALRRYASILNGKLPKPTSSGLPPMPNMAGISIAGLGGGKSASTGGGGGTGSGEEESFKIPPGEEVTVCHVISTCEYCADTVEALEELIRDTMQASSPYKSKVNMMAEQEAFHELTAKAIRVLVSGLTNRTQELAIKPGLLSNANNWGQWEAVGEESDYVRIIHQEVEPFCSSAKSLLPMSYFRSFCDKFAASFTSLYYDAVVRLKRINEAGTQQLLLDVYNLKTLFLKLPVLEESSAGSAVASSSSSSGANKKPASSIAPAMYTKLVQKQFGKIETLLKLVGTPVELLIDNFKSMSGGGASAAELQVVMSLKGIKRPEQVVLLEQFGLDPAKALKGATIGITSTSLVTERVQAVTSDLNQMRQKVDDFRRSFQPK